MPPMLTQSFRQSEVADLPGRQEARPDPELQSSCDPELLLEIGTMNPRAKSEPKPYMHITAEIKTHKRRLVGYLLRLVLSIWVLLFVFQAKAVSVPNYMVAVSPDANRVSIAKWTQENGWEIFESAYQRESFRKIRMPEGHLAGGEIAYSASGKELYFSTAHKPNSTALASAAAPHRVELASYLWRRKLARDGEEEFLEKIIDRIPMSNVLPLTDGSVVFMGKVSEIKSSSNIASAMGRTQWGQYTWMIRQADGTIRTLSSQKYAFFGSASLVRDEAILLVQRRVVDWRLVTPNEYFIDVTSLKPGVDIDKFSYLGNLKASHREQHLVCDWFGKTCAKTTSVVSYRYNSHQLELFRDGKSCKVTGLPDRIERMMIARNGEAVALITREDVSDSTPFKLVMVAIKSDGCAGNSSFKDLP